MNKKTEKKIRYISVGDRYFNWLCNICKVDESLTKLFYHLHYNLYFRATTVERDLNREADTKMLRQMFFGEEELPYDDFSSPASFLEFLVALAQRYSNIVDNPSNPQLDQHVKMFLHNCGLLKYDNIAFDPHKVDNIVYKVIHRTYRENGKGGLFPLKNPKEDQRDQEIIYQMYEYINEKDEKKYA